MKEQTVLLQSCECHAEAVTAIDDAVALLKRVRAHDHPALISAMEIQRKIHFYAAQ
jgi:hypothetical protein